MVDVQDTELQRQALIVCSCLLYPVNIQGLSVCQGSCANDSSYVNNPFPPFFDGPGDIRGVCSVDPDIVALPEVAVIGAAEPVRRCVTGIRLATKVIDLVSNATGNRLNGN